MQTILESLKFVQSAVARKEIVEGLSHFCIKDKRVTSHNGVITLSAPIAIDLDCNPKAESMLKAINGCKDTVVLKMTSAGRLSVKSGAFTANIDCVEYFDPETPDGEYLSIDGDAYIKAFESVLPFVGTDAYEGRSFTTGVLLHESSMYATNNVVISQYWMGQKLPHDITIPSIAIKEVCKIKQKLIGLQLTDKSVTFHFENDCWLKTVLLDANWPNLDNILNTPAQLKPIDDTIFDAIEVVRPFCDKKLAKIIIEKGIVRTHIDTLEGASYQIIDHSISATFQPDMLYLLKGVATHIDMTDHTKPCSWQGGNVRGVIIGIRI